MSWAEDNMIDIDPEDLGLLDTEPIWECKDGTLIPISEMTENHINNCIAMIKGLLEIMNLGEYLI